MRRLALAILMCCFIYPKIGICKWITAETKMDSVSKTFAINLLDTVVFDLSKADTLINSIEFPVYILSDDTVTALDFSFKYNEVDFSYDTIIDLTTYMQTFSYYNPFDSTFRFTSNSFQRYANDSNLVSLRFTVLSGEFCDDDLRTVKVYLNGDMCSYKIIDCIHVDSRQTEGNNQDVTVFPNPSSENFCVKIAHHSSLEMFAADGRKILQTSINPYQANEIITKQFATGIYFLRITNEKFTTTKKISIHK